MFMLYGILNFCLFLFACSSIYQLQSYYKQLQKHAICLFLENIQVEIMYKQLTEAKSYDKEKRELFFLALC